MHPDSPATTNRSLHPRSPAERAGTPRTNQLLASMPASAAARLAPHLTTVTLGAGEVLFAALERIRFVYFPDSAGLSMVTSMRDGSTVEVGTIGNEGFAGLPVVFGVPATATRCFAQVGGVARRMPVAAFRDAIGVFVARSRSEGLEPESVLASMKGVLHRRRAFLPPSEAAEDLGSFVLHAFLGACYGEPVSAPSAAAPLLAGMPLSARQWATLPVGER